MKNIGNFNLRVGNAQIQGARPEQQDAFGFSDKDDAIFVQHGGVLAVVADGMGGHAWGGEASRVAVKTFLRTYMGKPKNGKIPDALLRSFNAANQAVCEFAKTKGELDNCGTTLVAAVVHPQSLSLDWIGTGDSRIYLLRSRLLTQVTTDGTYGNQRIKNAIQGLAFEPLGGDNVALRGLTSFLGLKELDEIDRSIRRFRLCSGDWVVLCTDGVFDTLSSLEMLECLTGDPNVACEKLTAKATDKHLANQDNATVAIITCEFGPLPAWGRIWKSMRKAFQAKNAFLFFLGLLVLAAFLLGVYVGHGLHLA